MSQNPSKSSMANRFRGLLPVVIDLETSGIDASTDALLEIAAVTLCFNAEGLLCPDKTFSYHIEPFEGARIDPESLKITGIKPYYPLRFAISEKQALHNIFSKVRTQIADMSCQRAVLVGHNAWFDLAFIQAAVKRTRLKNPFHSFTTFDTATLAAVALGETVLAKAVKAIHMPFDINLAHSAAYDAERTAELFCYLVNRMRKSTQNLN